LRAAEEMAARIPNARKVILKGSGHVPSYEQPEIHSTTDEISTQG
jgi:pimeloyl-ACP methyl ester carboxylesterase